MKKMAFNLLVLIALVPLATSLNTASAESGLIAQAKTLVGKEVVVTLHLREGGRHYTKGDRSSWEVEYKKEYGRLKKVYDDGILLENPNRISNRVLSEDIFINKDVIMMIEKAR